MDDDAIRDLFGSLNGLSIRRMFGGKGIYADGVIFALDIGDSLVLKADEAAVAAFREAGCRQWICESSSRKPVAMPYWTAPDEALDDADAMAAWARIALEAALRAEARKRKTVRRVSGRSS